MVLIGCILLRSDISLSYAALGLHLWFEKMIPALFPFMLLSGIMVRMKLTESFIAVIHPIIAPIFKVSKNVCYAMFMGFLCGFPMGAKTVAELYEHNMITKSEAEYLLAFCNNIGPVYFVSFVLPMLGLQGTLPYLFGMYGIPLLYGLLLRYTCYRNKLSTNRNRCQKQVITSKRRIESTPNSIPPLKLLAHIEDAIHASVQSVLMLGGYMILFNLLNLIPHILLGKPSVLLAPLFEISGGLKLLGDSFPLYTLLILPFGGLSCIAQTYSCIQKTELSIMKYTMHKLVLTVLVSFYYLLRRFLLETI